MLMLFFYFFFFFRLVSIYIGGFFLHIFVVYLIINLECIIQKSKYIRVNYKDINLEMKPLILISILALFYLGHAIVIELILAIWVPFLSHTGLKITASPEEVKRAY